MSSNWEKIDQICQAALEIEPDRREAFVSKACDGDEALHKEVESLLAFQSQSLAFIEKPAFQALAETLAEARTRSLEGRQIGAYRIDSLIGAGGMGEVYKAKDTRLNRTVAIKVLPHHLSERPDLRQRFEREAKAIASLSHPHICSLFDIGNQEGVDFLVMEYLEGETLSQRLKKGRLPTDQVLRYATEVASALDQAHRRGVIHRDLKPGNIILVETGAKLLDFGLAKQSGGAGAPRTLLDARGSARPTQSESLTEDGMILGTLEYMSPEQLEGKEADTRTDLFALGVVIYEMATGRKAFEADSKASLIAKILTFEPPAIQTIQPVSPPELDIVVRRCLAKKPEERWQSAAELTSELQDIAETALPQLKARKRGKESSAETKEIESEVQPAVPLAIPEPAKVLSRPIGSRAWKLGFVGIGLTLFLGSLVLWFLRLPLQKPPEKPMEPSSKPLTSYSWDNALDSAAISPDGKYLAYCSKGRLFVQISSSKERRSLALPEGFFPAGVSWYPDGTKLLLSRLERQWIQMKGETRRISDRSQWSLSILGGTPQKVVDHTWDASVSPDGSQVAFSRFDPERETVDLWLVNDNGEGLHQLRAPTQPKQGYFNPRWSSDGQRLFFIHGSEKDASIESCNVGGQEVTTTFSTKVTKNGIGNLCVSPDGRIFFAMQEPGIQILDNMNLWEIKVDTATGRPLSEARHLTQWSGFSTRAVSDLSMTADGRRLVLLRWNAQGDVFVAEAEAGGKSMKNPRRLTLEESDDAAWDWTADSRAILLVSYRNGNGDIYEQEIGQTDAEVVVATPEDEGHPNFSPDRRFILYLVSVRRGVLAGRLMRVPVGGGPRELVLTGEKIKSFSCAREANLCVVAEEVEGKQVLSTFDPLKGRGEKLPMTDCPDFERGILSSQGRLIEKMKSGPDGLYLRVRSLRGGPVQEITFKNLNGDYQFQGWSFDGKGIYLGDESLSLFATVVYAGLDGQSQVLWKTGLNPGWRGLDVPVASPDGRYLALTAIYDETNAWMLENF